MPEDGFHPWDRSIDARGHTGGPYAATEGDMLSCNFIAITVVPRSGLGMAAAWEECARRSEVSQR